MLCITAVSAALMMLAIVSLKRSGLPGVRQWLWASVCTTVAMVLFAARDQIPDVLSIPLANGLLAASIFLLASGTRIFFGQPSGWKIGAAAVIAFVALISWFTWIQPDFNLRVGLASLLHASATIWLALIVRRAPAAVSRYSRGYCVTVAFAEAAIHAVRGTLYVISPAQHGVFESTVLNLASFSIGTLGMPALIIGLMMLAHDRLRSTLERQIDVDELTGAASRRAFLRHAERLLTQAQRDGQAVSIAMIDIDWFKRLNDTFGHSGGDTVLRHFVDTALASLRDHDLLGRLGGEEFGILMPGADASRIRQWLDRLREQLAQSGLHLDQQAVSYTFSAGVVDCSHAPSLNHALKLADRLLYQAKESGRNTTC